MNTKSVCGSCTPYIGIKVGHGTLAILYSSSCCLCMFCRRCLFYASSLEGEICGSSCPAVWTGQRLTVALLGCFSGLPFRNAEVRSSKKFNEV